MKVKKRKPVKIKDISVYLVIGIILLFATVSTSLISTVINRLLEGWGVEINTAPRLIITLVILIAIALVLQVFARIVQNWFPASIEKEEMNILGAAMNLTTDIAAKKLMIQSNQIKSLVVKDDLFFHGGVQQIEALLQEVAYKMQESLFVMLNPYNNELHKDDFSVSIAYLFDPPSVPHNYCSDAAKGQWQGVRDSGKVDIAVLDRVICGSDRDRRQATLSKALADRKPIYDRKRTAYKNKYYIPSDNDPRDDGMLGSIYCHPLFDNKDSSSYYVAGISVSTYKTPFAKSKKIEKVLKNYVFPLFFIKLENMIKTELMNLYYLKLRESKKINTAR